MYIDSNSYLLVTDGRSNLIGSGHQRSKRLHVVHMLVLESNALELSPVRSSNTDRVNLDSLSCES